MRRRAFLGRAALAVAAPYVVPASSVGADGRPAPSEYLALGLIGLGSMGMRHLQGFLQEGDCRIAAVCDVDAARRRAAAEETDRFYGRRGCAEVHDFRDLVAREGLDGLCISVPDHWHAVISIAGLRAGKHIYGEKPLALTIAEGQAIVREVRRYGRVWQTGSWQRSKDHFRFACELVRNGRIGRVGRVEVGIGVGSAIGPQPPMPVPEGFDYDLWLGPAPWEPYTEKRCHWNFRWILDYSGGQVTDWGAHHIDIAHWGMGADGTGPLAVAGSGEFPSDGLWNTAVHYRFTCEYAGGVTMEVASNNFLPQGVRWIGDRGWVHVTRRSLDAEPKRLLRETIGPGEVRLPRPRGDDRQGHRRDFLDCVRTGAEPISPADVGHRSATVAHLGNIAMLVGRRIRWDPEGERIIDDPTAARMLSRAMRGPWRL